MKRSSSFLLALLFLLPSGIFAQLNAEVEVENPTREINDGKARVHASGGKKPYRYKWSVQSISQTSDSAVGLTEGAEYTVAVSDAAGDTVRKTLFIETTSLGETMNSWFKPAVARINDFLFWDPFSAMGIHDPVIRTKKFELTAPKARDTAVHRITLKKWLVPDESVVEEEERIALVSLDGKEKAVRAPQKGTLVQNVKEGETLSDELGEEELRKKGTPVAFIEFDSKQPLYHPNGDERTTDIPFIVVWLIFGAIFFTLKMRFINFRGIKHALHLVQGKYDDPNASGTVSHFQALTTALSATVGLGNIAGVAIAITMGGPGATFWLVIAGLFGMTSKFAECFLGVKYRDILPNGETAGGPMYYLRKGLKEKSIGGMNLGGLGLFLAGLFSFMCVFSSFAGGNMFQANQAVNQITSQIGFLQGYSGWLGVFLALLVALVIIGGIRSIARVTDKVVPFMVSIYVIFSIIIIAMNFYKVDDVLAQIVSDAFTPSSMKGGFIGILVIGIRRGAFSNEAGVGSAAVKTDRPMSEGFVAMLEPAVDTVVVCTMTSLVLIFTGFADGAEGIEGAELTSAAFSQIFPWFKYVLMLAIVLFAFSTMISWSYYGLKAWKFLFGENRTADVIYKTLFCGFIVVGASSELGAVVDFSDMMLLGMALPNILGVLLLSGEVRRDLKDYFGKVKQGIIQKVR